jgi:hypothetical protein
MSRLLWTLIVLGCVPTISIAAEPKPEIVSPLTLVVEENLIENPKAILKGKVESVLWQHLGIQSTAGEGKEVLAESRLSKYDADGRVIEVTERGLTETRLTNTYENGLLVSKRGRGFKTDGTPLGEEFWQIHQYDANGQLLDLKRGHGQKLENHYVSNYDSSGRLIRQEIRHGEQDALVYIEQFLYSGKPATMRRRILSPKGAARESTRLCLDESGNIAELWGERGYHVAWKYNNQHAVIEQSTDSYKFPDGCDECPLPGVIRTRYEGNLREQTFFEPGGKAVLKRITLLEQDGSIASIRYQRPEGANPEDAPMLNRIVNAITRPGGERYVETSWDNNGNWVEKRECYRPHAAQPIVLAIYRRKITYR